MTSVLQPWVMDLPLREQGTLLVALRGCDLTPKYPLDSAEREIVAYLRWLVQVPHDPREIDFEPGCYMRSTLPRPFKPSAWEHYPMHWYTHVLHALEVVGYRHPDPKIARESLAMYLTMVKSLHLEPELRQQMIARLSEDRVTQGSVLGVSTLEVEA